MKLFFSEGRMFTKISTTSFSLFYEKGGIGTKTSDLFYFYDIFVFLDNNRPKKFAKPKAIAEGRIHPI